MHLPKPAPALRGPLLRLVERLSRVPFLRDLILAKMRKDGGIAALPDLG